MVTRWRMQMSMCAVVLVIVATGTSARAGVAARRSHRVTSGDSLWKIARAYQCDVDDLRRANRLDGNTIHAGQRLRIPACKPARGDGDATSRVSDKDDGRRRGAAAAEIDALEKALREAREELREEGSVGALEEGAEEEGAAAEESAVVESVAAESPAEESVAVESAVVEKGAAELREPDWMKPKPRPRTAMVDEAAGRREEIDGDRMRPIGVPISGQSIGRPQNGYLVSGKRIPRNSKAYYIRRPERAWGANHTVDLIVKAIRQVRRRYPRVHPLAIGDLSARHGGRISMHGSHQSGRDADIGFYFRRQPKGYPRGFAVAKGNDLDFPATWAFISALCRTAKEPLGVERIYMTYRTQALFYRLARKHGVSRARLAEWFQYPRGRRADHGIIRHEPGHEEHIHVRFRCAPNDPECR
ncbi:MAG TPA: penicillin-insensitive murein endopeptidase [Kofleriaceae bacterium]|nr:penicillin-insensitive murein endopeptidase [Kofleriaceae bacterium]